MTTHFIGTSHLGALNKSLIARQAKCRIGNFRCYWANNSIYQKPKSIGIDDSNIVAIEPKLIESWNKYAGTHVIKISEGDTVVFSGFINPIPQYTFLTDTSMFISRACRYAWINDILGVAILPTDFIATIVSMPIRVFIVDAPLWSNSKTKEMFKNPVNLARHAEFISHYEKFCSDKGITYIRQPSDTLASIDEELFTKMIYLKDDGYHWNEDGADIMSMTLEAQLIETKSRYSNLNP